MKSVQKREKNVGTSKTVNSSTQHVNKQLQMPCAASSTPMTTRSKSKSKTCGDTEMPRSSDLVCEDLLDSPEKCDFSYHSDIHADPLITDSMACLPVAMGIDRPQESMARFQIWVSMSRTSRGCQPKLPECISLV